MLASPEMARGQAVQGGALRRAERRPARAARGSSVRRHLARGARGVPRPQPVQRRPPDPAGHGGRGRCCDRGLAPARSPRTRRGAGLLVPLRRTTSARTASPVTAPASSPRSGPSRTRTAWCCRTSARTAARRKGGCGSSARPGHSSSRSSSSTKATRSEPPTREPDLQSGGDKLWRIGDAPSIEQTQLLIADGHHRYETALAYAEEGGSPYLMVVLVPTRQEGLTIFPTHRVAERVNGAGGTPIDEPGDELPGVVLYRDGPVRAARRRRARRRHRRASSHQQGVTYTPQREDAVAAVDRGDAEAAFLLRPDAYRGRVGGCAARRDDAAEEHVLLSQADVAACSSTRLTDWLALCRAAVDDVRGVLLELPGRVRARTGCRPRNGGDETTAIDAAAESVILARLRRARRRRSSPRKPAPRETGTTLRRRRPDRRLAQREARHRLLLSVSIAVASGPTMGDVDFGFVHDFGTGEEWTGDARRGARRERCAARRSAAEGRIEILSFEATRTAVSRRAGRGRSSALRTAFGIMGSLALSLCHLAAGRVDAVCSLCRRGPSTSRPRSSSSANAGLRSTSSTRRRSGRRRSTWKGVHAWPRRERLSCADSWQAPCPNRLWKPSPSGMPNG